MFKISVIFGVALKRLLIEKHLQRAGSLSYTTLLSIVPLLSTLVSLFALFPLFNRVMELTQEYAQKNFIPESGGLIETQLESFIVHAGRLPVVSIVVLIITTVLLMISIESALNAICHVTEKKRKLSRLLIYWGLLIVIPILVGAGLLFSSYLFSLSWFGELMADKEVKLYLLASLPLIINTLLFSLLYCVVPNIKMHLSSIFLGGFTAAILFELTKRGFGFYVAHFSSYQLIYGALAIIPIFMFWLYVSWLIILFGMIVTHTAHQRSAK